MGDESPGHGPVVLLAAPEDVLRAGGAHLLTSRERRRAGALRHRADRDTYVAAHLLVRHCAAALTGRPLESLELVQQCTECGSADHGRPSLAGLPDLHVSLAHTRRAVVAGADRWPIGVDVEGARTGPPDPAVLTWALTATEAAQVRSAGDPSAEFLRHWVRKECLVKVGAVTLDELSRVELDPATRLDGEDGRTWHRFGRLHLVDWFEPTLDVAVAAAAHEPPAVPRPVSAAGHGRLGRTTGRAPVQISEACDASACVVSASGEPVPVPTEVALRRPVIVLGALALVLSGAGTASAEPPLEVPDPITDRVGALENGASAAEQAAADLAAEGDLGLHAVFVSSFDGTDAGEWARESARMSDLGDDDLLLAVAVGETTYEYGYWVNGSFPLSEVDLERAMTLEVEPRLTAGDRSGAVVALAGRLQELVAIEEEAARETAPWSAGTIILVVGGVAIFLLAAHLLSRRRSSTPPS